jgi:ferredoxin
MLRGRRASRARWVGGRRSVGDRCVGEAYTITLLPMAETLICGRGETVLSAILRSGARVVVGCTGGGCGVCKMRLISGRLDRGRCSVAVLSEEEKREGFFLSCQAKPLSDLTIQLTEANRYRKTATFLNPPLILR